MCYETHEKPADGEQPVEAAIPFLSVAPDDPHEKDETSLLISRSPQEGHLKLFSSSEGKTICSKQFPHLLHLYS